MTADLPGSLPWTVARVQEVADLHALARASTQAFLNGIDPDARCRDFTQTPRGWVQCQLPAGHAENPLSMHHCDPFGPVVKCDQCDNPAAVFGASSLCWDCATEGDDE